MNFREIKHSSSNFQTLKAKVNFFRKSNWKLATWHRIASSSYSTFFCSGRPKTASKIPKCIPLATKHRLSIFIIELFFFVDKSQTFLFVISTRMTIIHLVEFLLLSLLTKVCVVWWKRFPRTAAEDVRKKSDHENSCGSTKNKIKEWKWKGLGKKAIKAFLL